MDDIIYKLLVKSRAGWTAFGVLRYRLTGFEVDGATPGIFAGQPALQQQPNVGAVVYRAQGSISIPLLGIVQAKAVEGLAFFIQMGPPLLTRLESDAGIVNLAFNLVNNEQMAGGLVWAPGNQSFCLLGRRLILPA